MEKGSRQGRDMQRIDQCLDRLGEVCVMANQIRQALETMNTKLHGPKPPQPQPSSPAVQPVQSNMEEMAQKIMDLYHQLTSINESVLSLNRFINAEID